ncbi:hypothetical protein [Hoyosella altamirensis]|uniref:Uncharacterized protein n=1 Tax=Hoyosella altamirensis TaxID=616997 RepID=A0A839RWA4_9ACTN|nr:hypothetical protein [Hoyosella altamirensis]MBB3040123.1 hypothetical protein [Hoyosella altamirensis]
MARHCGSCGSAPKAKTERTPVRYEFTTSTGETRMFLSRMEANVAKTRDPQGTVTPIRE